MIKVRSISMLLRIIERGVIAEAGSADKYCPVGRTLLSDIRQGTHGRISCYRAGRYPSRSTSPDVRQECLTHQRGKVSEATTQTRVSDPLKDHSRAESR